MREYAKLAPTFWVDHKGRQWPVVTSPRRLKFKNRSHAALRAFVFQRDRFKCVRCSASAVNVPADYDGRYTLFTDALLSSGYPDLLVVDHILTLKAGGKNRIENFQTLCETCNRKKLREDMAAAAKALAWSSLCFE